MDNFVLDWKIFAEEVLGEIGFGSDARAVACRDTAREDHCHCRHLDFLIGSYPRLEEDALIQKIYKLDDTTSQILEDQAIFDNDLKTIGLQRGQAGENTDAAARLDGQKRSSNWR